MNIILKTELPSLYELDLIYSGEEYPVMAKFYNELERNKRDHEYCILNSPSNAEKIIRFFNSESEMNELKKELIKIYSLEGKIIIKNIFANYVNGAKNLSKIGIFVNIKLLDSDLIKFVDESMNSLIKMIYESDKNKVISRYSLKFKEQLEINEISGNKNDNSFRLKLKANYTMNKEDFNYFDFFRDERIIFNVKCQQNKEINIELNKVFLKK